MSRYQQTLTCPSKYLDLGAILQIDIRLRRKCCAERGRQIQSRALHNFLLLSCRTHLNIRILLLHSGQRPDMVEMAMCKQHCLRCHAFILPIANQHICAIRRIYNERFLRLCIHHRITVGRTDTKHFLCYFNLSHKTPFKVTIAVTRNL